MSLWNKIFGGGKSPDPEPFLDHPTGEFDNAIAAMENAIIRLRKLPNWEQWIEFGGQGEGSRPESYEFAEIRMLRDKIDVGNKPLDVQRIIQAASAGTTSLVPDGPHYSVAAASPREAAQIFDAIFRHHFNLRPFADENDDYAVVTEW